MNQYEKQEALHAIDGYWMPEPGIGDDVAKLRQALAEAKQQFITAMRKRIENVESISLDQFKAYKGDCWPKANKASERPIYRADYSDSIAADELSMDDHRERDEDFYGFGGL